MIKKKCLFLGYSERQTRLINIIKKRGWNVIQKKSSLNNLNLSKYDSILSFGYKHIINKELIKKLRIPIINLHIGYLPYNKGSHPNLWSFLDQTPSGVSIHEIDSNIDSGPIILRKIIEFNKSNLTFFYTYNRLKFEIENLFIENIDKLMNYKYSTVKQRRGGTIHYKKDLEILKKNKIFKGWKDKISKTVKAYDHYSRKINKEKLSIIDEIEKTRTKNNINWMDLLRNSYISSPKKTMKILKKINNDDNKISSLFYKLTK